MLSDDGFKISLEKINGYQSVVKRSTKRTAEKLRQECQKHWFFNTMKQDYVRFQTITSFGDKEPFWYAKQYIHGKNLREIIEMGEYKIAEEVLFRVFDWIAWCKTKTYKSLTGLSLNSALYVSAKNLPIKLNMENLEPIKGDETLSHGNLKMENIIVENRTGSVYLIDFEKPLYSHYYQDASALLYDLYITIVKAHKTHGDKFFYKMVNLLPTMHTKMHRIDSEYAKSHNQLIAYRAATEYVKKKGKIHKEAAEFHNRMQKMLFNKGE